MTIRRALLFWVILLISISAQAKYLSPYDFGLAAAKGGVETYHVLLKTHEAAVAQGCNVTYKGIEYLELEIPADAKSIPLPEKVDFHGVKMTVRNNARSLFLFSITQNITPVDIDKRSLSMLDFDEIKELRKGSYLLIIEDKKPWVEKRGGYDYGATRKDIIVVKNGKGKNNVVYSYDTKASEPQVCYFKLNHKKKIYNNLDFERSADSKNLTWLFKIENQYNITLNNICIKTPNSDLYEDCAIQIRNCAKVLLKDVTIAGTYSAKNKYGYGISMNNVYDSRFVRLKGYGEWGVFGNNNVNKAYLEDCNINRFDIHCYGKDVYCKNTVFRDWYNQFSSFFGTLSFEKCTFVQFVPVLFEPSYSAYTPFFIRIKNCVIEVDKRRPFLIDAGYPSVMKNASRVELSDVYWPNIEIEGLEVKLPEGQKKWSLFYVNGKDVPEISGISRVSIKKLTIDGEARMDVVPLANKQISTKEDLQLNISSSNVKEIVNDANN